MSRYEWGSIEVLELVLRLRDAAATLSEIERAGLAVLVLGSGTYAAAGRNLGKTGSAVHAAGRRAVRKLRFGRRAEMILGTNGGGEPTSDGLPGNASE